MKIGLVLEGGGNRTIFTSGILDAMIDNNIRADYIIGASAGIAYGVNYASWQKGRTLEIFNKYTNDKRNTGFRHWLNRNNRSFFNLDFNYNKIPNELVPFDYETFKNFPGEVEAIVTNINSGKAEYHNVPYDDKNFQLLRATCALPLAFPPIIIDGKEYMDGALTVSIPVNRAFEKGCNKVIVILTREKEYVKGDEKHIGIFKLIYRKYPKLVKLIQSRPKRYNQERKRLFELEKAGKALVFMPNSSQDFSRVEKNMEKIHNLYNDGYEKAINNIDRIREFCNT